MLQSTTCILVCLLATLRQFLMVSLSVNPCDYEKFVIETCCDRDMSWMLLGVSGHNPVLSKRMCDGFFCELACSAWTTDKLFLRTVVLSSDEES